MRLCSYTTVITKTVITKKNIKQKSSLDWVYFANPCFRPSLLYNFSLYDYTAIY